MKKIARAAQKDDGSAQFPISVPTGGQLVVIIGTAYGSNEFGYDELISTDQEMQQKVLSFLYSLGFQEW